MSTSQSIALQAWAAALDNRTLAARLQIIRDRPRFYSVAERKALLSEAATRLTAVSS